MNFDGFERHGVRLPKWSDVSMILVNDLISISNNVYVNFNKSSVRNTSRRRISKRYYGDIIVDIDFASEKASKLFENLEHKIKNIKKYVKAS